MPQTLVEAVGAAVEGGGILVGGEVIGLALQLEGSVCDAVGTAAHGCAEIAVALAVAVDVVIAQNNVGHAAVLVGDPQADQSCAVIGDVSGDGTAGDGVELSLLAIGQCAERFCHSD